MRTLIKSISFNNFYNYYGSFDENTYKFKEGINVINADNNMGKSKFYNGFLWIMRDEVYDSDEKKMLPVSDSYFKMMSGKARRESSQISMGVKVVYESAGITYTIKKKVRCICTDGQWVYTPRTTVTQTVDNSDNPIMDIEEQQTVIRNMIPPEMQKYSLLQGESIEGLVDLSTTKGIDSTILALADIKNLVDMCKSADYMVSRARAACRDEEKRNSKANDEIVELQAQRDQLESWITGANEKIELAKKELSKAREAKSQIEAEIFNSKKRLKVGAEYKAESKKLDDYKNQKEQEELSITSHIFDENCPWLLLGLDNEATTFDQRRIELQTQLTTRHIQEHPDILLPAGSPDSTSLHRMLKNCTCEVCGRDFEKDSQAWHHMKMILERPHKPMLKSNSFMDYYGEIQKSAARYVTTIPMIEDNYLEYMNNIFNLEEKISAQTTVVEQKGEELALVGNDTKESDDLQVLSSYNKAEQVIRDKEKEIKKHNDNITIWSSRLEDTKRAISKKQNSQAVIKAQKDYDDLVHIASIFKETKERIYDSIVDGLQDSSNKMYRGLTAGSQTLGGNIVFNRQEDGTVRVTVLNNAGEPLYGSGTGFQRMKQLAIVMSIISSQVGNKQFDYPFISDAPFSEFGVNLINNFFDLAPTVFGQSIIMIKDLYDPTSNDLILPGGLKIVERMKNGELNGTFYVNYIEEKADTSNLVTRKKCYFE